MSECAHGTRRIFYKVCPFDTEKPNNHFRGEGNYLGNVMRGIHAVEKNPLFMYTARHTVPCESMSGLRVLSKERDVLRQR
jgi:hypothetical protein